ncbi:MAG TPA: DNA-3-methyladenine glycosylase [Dermatophilaceae bacterium]
MAGQEDRPQDRLTRAFFARPVLDVAPELLGCHISHAGVTLRLTEVEAYDGSNDPGSHAFRGPTPRTRVMFGEPGGLYVYFTYGMHWCANLVCGSAGAASAVLMRAGEVVEGLELARTRRPRSSDRDLARGPARLAMALAVGRDQNGMDTCATDSVFVVRTGLRDPSSASTNAGVRTGPRVGVSGRGGDEAAYPWRFWLQGEATVSAYRAGTVRPSKPAGRSPQV